MTITIIQIHEVLELFEESDELEVLELITGIGVGVEVILQFNSSCNCCLLRLVGTSLIILLI
jgi:hypothetical protein